MKTVRHTFWLSCLVLFGFLALFSAPDATSTGVHSANVAGEYTATVGLPGGFGADLTITFEEVTGLSESALDVTARLADPFDPAFTARLPSSGLATLTTGLPVIITIEAPPGSSLSMRGLASVGLHTENLPYVPGTRLRLFSAAPGEAFQDVTAEVSSGSFRTGGRTPDFYREDYLILLDQRSGAQVVDDKVFTLRATLNQFALEMDALVRAELDRQLIEIEEAIDDATPAAADQLLDSFTEMVRDHAGTGIPDVWSASDQADNVAGELLSKVATLQFSLRESL